MTASGGPVYVGGGGLPPVDVSEYADLRLFDRTDQDMINTAIAAGQLSMPGWNPNEGNIEVLLIELLALITSENVVAINRVPGAVIESIISMVGVERDYGAAPTANITIAFSDMLGHTVPAGTRFYAVTDDAEVVTFLLEFPGASAEYGATVAVGSIIGGEFTDAANGMLPGTTLQTAEPLAFIDSVTLSTPVVDGRNPETSQEWRSRGVSRLQGLSSVLVSPQQFEAAARGYAEVARAVGIDLYNPGAHAVGGRVNLLPDPGFEAGTSAVASATARSGVTVSAVTRGTAVTPPEGTGYASINVTGDSGSTVDRTDVTVRTVPVAVQAGKIYRLQFDGNPASGAFYGRVGAEWIDAGGALVTDSPVINGGYLALSASNWRNIGIYAQAPAGATQVRMTVAFANASTVSTAARFDRLLIEDASTFRGTWFATTASSPDIPGDDAGHMTVAVLSEGGYKVSDAHKATIENDLTERAVALLDVHIVDANLVTVDVTATFTPLEGYSGPDIAGDVRAALRAYLDPVRWFWGSVVRHNELVSLIDRVEGVDWVGDIVIAGASNGGAGDLALSGPTSLPRYGTLAVTSVPR